MEYRQMVMKRQRTLLRDFISLWAKSSGAIPWGGACRSGAIFELSVLGGREPAKGGKGILAKAGKGSFV